MYVRLEHREATAVHERDHRDAVDDGHAIGVVEERQAPAVAALLARPLDQLVERWVVEATSFVWLLEWNNSRRKYSGSAYPGSHPVK